MAGKVRMAGLKRFGDDRPAAPAVPLTDAAFRRRHCPAKPAPPPTLNDIVAQHAKLSRRLRKARPIEPEIGPTPEQAARHVYHTAQVKDPEAPAPRFVKRNMTTRNIERWHHRGLIADVEAVAAMRYRDDYELSGWSPRVVSRYSPAQGFGGEAVGPGPSTHRQMDAWARWRAARDQLPVALREGFDAVALQDMATADTGADPLAIFQARTMRAAVAICVAQLVVHYRL